MDTEKINELLKIVRRLNFDEFNEQLTFENNLDNLLIELKHHEEKFNEHQNRINVIIAHLSNCFAGDFFNDLPVSDKEDELDVVCMGFNTYIEELRGALVSRDILEKVNVELLKEKEVSEKLARAKDIFMSNMSHEIRTPLNGIIGFTQILENTELTDIQRKHLKTIKVSGNILLVLINNVLELEYLNSNNVKLVRESLKINELIPYFSSTFHETVLDKGLKLELNIDSKIPHILFGDSSKLAQIYINILSNAIKFTPSNGKISVNYYIESENEKECLLKIEIVDNGIGINTDNLNTIFDPFVQKTADLARTYGGTGLGLTIAKKTVDLFNGTIEIESEIGVGTKVSISIPLEKEIKKIEDSKINTENTMANYKSISILVAEDNAINQLLIKTILQKEGFEVEIAENGKLAVEALEKSDYHIVLMDLMMPEMNGYEASLAIRELENPIKASIPIIAVSADVTKDVKDKCKDAGMNDYVSKPYEAKHLIEKILEHVK
jgi:two-component system CheB/CheR fusion protein